MACCFYGISFDIGGFGLNLYLTQLTFALIEIPAKFIVYYLLDKIGRRKTLGGSLSFVGICILINIFIPRGMVSPDCRHSKPIVCIHNLGLVVFQYELVKCPTK